MPDSLPKGAGIGTDNSLVPAGMAGLAAADARQRNPDFRRDINLSAKPSSGPAMQTPSSAEPTVAQKATAVLSGMRSRAGEAITSAVKNSVRRRMDAAKSTDASK